jgi:ElaB/YqjD/DUF883 family membrane-anchored ribosome-binding protein
MRCATHSVNKEQLIDDFKNVLEKAEALVAEGASETSDRLASARTRMEHVLGDAKQRAAEMEAALLDQAKAAVTRTEQSVQAHPWSTIGLSAGVGLLVGLLIARGNK